MSEIEILAAVGRRHLLEALCSAEEQPFVVFGTLDGKAMSRLGETFKEAAGRKIKVYMYETG